MTAVAHPVILPPGARDTPTTLVGEVTAILEVAVMGDQVQMGISPEVEAEAVAIGLRRRTAGECLLNETQKSTKYSLSIFPRRIGEGREHFYSGTVNAFRRTSESKSDLQSIGARAGSQRFTMPLSKIQEAPLKTLRHIILYRSAYPPEPRKPAQAPESRR